MAERQTITIILRDSDRTLPPLPVSALRPLGELAAVMLGCRYEEVSILDGSAYQTGWILAGPRVEEPGETAEVGV